jgi:hypothetical protein
MSQQESKTHRTPDGAIINASRLCISPIIITTSEEERDLEDARYWIEMRVRYNLNLNPSSKEES